MQNEKLKEVILTTHKRCRKKTQDKLYKKLMRLRLVWSKENNSTPEELEDIICSFINKPCFFCKEVVDAKNISLDHIIPTHRGGESSIKNITIVCDRCNRRKGILTRGEYVMLLNSISKFNEVAISYILRKLGSRDMWGVDKISKKD